jgi:hypothetical protein
MAARKKKFVVTECFEVSFFLFVVSTLVLISESRRFGSKARTLHFPAEKERETTLTLDDQTILDELKKPSSPDGEAVSKNSATRRNRRR